MKKMRGQSRGRSRSKRGRRRRGRLLSGLLLWAALGFLLGILVFAAGQQLERTPFLGEEGVTVQEQTLADFGEGGESDGTN
ncbi:MAG: hypothetical protein Q4D90_03530 [bacterium]|nr:hypothetical protein [bacterium]